MKINVDVDKFVGREVVVNYDGVEYRGILKDVRKGTITIKETQNRTETFPRDKINIYWTPLI